MQNRIRLRPNGRNTATTTAVIPMPGRLLVDYYDYDWDLHLPYSVPLDEVNTGTVVTAIGTITHVRYLDRQKVRRVVRHGGSSLGRVMIVLKSADGNTAHVTLNADVARMLQPVLFAGTKLRVRGMVARTISSQPAGIDGLGIQVVDV